MPLATVRVVDVYPYRLAAGGPEFLVLRRSPERVYAGQWRVVGGAIEPGETAWEAAARELAEETGFAPGAGLRAFWALPSVNTFYEWRRDAVELVPAFAAEVAGGVRLDGEHDAWAWLAPDEAAARLAWPEPRRLPALAAHLVTSRTAAPELGVPLDRLPGRGTAGGGTRDGTAG